jgi:hypothetical protein
MSEEQKKMSIQEKDIVEDPYSDVDGMIDLLIADEPVPKIKDSNKEILDYTNTPRPEKIGAVIDPPLEEQPLIDPILEASKGAVSVNVKKSAALDKFVGDPLDNDNLVSVVRSNKPTVTVLNAIMEEIAEEAAYIKAWRAANWDLSKDFSDTTFKRIKMLKSLVDTVSEKEKLRKASNVGKIDFHGESFQRVLKYFLETIQTTFKKINIPAQYENIFFPLLAKEFDGFEKKAEKIYYGKD